MLLLSYVMTSFVHDWNKSKCFTNSTFTRIRNSSSPRARRRYKKSRVCSPLVIFLKNGPLYFSKAAYLTLPTPEYLTNLNTNYKEEDDEDNDANND